MKIAVVIPSMRGSEALERFIEISPDNVDFIIISQEKLGSNYEKTIEFNDKEVFEKSWIFNRVTKRNFGFLYAYKQDYDVMITLDDDCFPLNNNFFSDHLDVLESKSSDHFSTLKSYSEIPENVGRYGARGYPTVNEKQYPVVMNQGLWLGDLDLPAKTIGDVLNSKDGKIPPPLSEEPKVVNDFVIPKGQFCTFCGMNVAFKKRILPAAQWTYQDPDGDGIARYDDIWAG